MKDGYLKLLLKMNIMLQNIYQNYESSSSTCSHRQKTAQQSVHLTLGILRQSQAVSYALAFFWLDGFAVPAPAQVTQTVRCLLH